VEALFTKVWEFFVAASSFVSEILLFPITTILFGLLWAAQAANFVRERPATRRTDFPTLQLQDVLSRATLRIWIVVPWLLSFMICSVGWYMLGDLHAQVASVLVGNLISWIEGLLRDHVFGTEFNLGRNSAGSPLTIGTSASINLLFVFLIMHLDFVPTLSAAVSRTTRLDRLSFGAMRAGNQLISTLERALESIGRDRVREKFDASVKDMPLATVATVFSQYGWRAPRLDQPHRGLTELEMLFFLIKDGIRLHGATTSLARLGYYNSPARSDYIPAVKNVLIPSCLMYAITLLTAVTFLAAAEIFPTTYVHDQATLPNPLPTPSHQNLGAAGSIQRTVDSPFYIPYPTNSAEFSSFIVLFVMFTLMCPVGLSMACMLVRKPSIEEVCLASSDTIGKFAMIFLVGTALWVSGILLQVFANFLGLIPSESHTLRKVGNWVIDAVYFGGFMSALFLLSYGKFSAHVVPIIRNARLQRLLIVCFPAVFLGLFVFLGNEPLSPIRSGLFGTPQNAPLCGPQHGPLQSCPAPSFGASWGVVVGLYASLTCWSLTPSRPRRADT
jgi:hypothetical protein